MIMELWKGTAPKAQFYLPSSHATVQQVVLTRNGETETLMHSPAVNGAVSVQLPYLQNDEEFTVDWTFVLDNQNYTETDYYEVITPVLNTREIKKIHPVATDEEIIRIEAAVRHIIQAHTGQNFGKFVGVKSVRGDNNRALFLPDRLIELKSVNGSTSVKSYFSVDDDGFVLRHFPWGVPPVKADYHGLHQHVGGVIHNPNNVNMGVFYKSMVYEIEGEWGWDFVPAAVKEAAKLLVNDYACAEQSYRDRYLTSMTAADWRIQYHSGAFRETGNVRADQLLNDYVLKRGWAVI